MTNSDQLARLDRLPEQTVRPRGRVAREDLQEWARLRSQHLVEVDLSACSDKHSVLAAIGAALGFGDSFGANLDALSDSLTDLPDRDDGPGGWLVLLDGLPQNAAFSTRDKTALLEVFRDAAPQFADRGIALRVLYR
jgi:RNAse (barnase) inhibitor barstar